MPAPMNSTRILMSLLLVFGGTVFAQVTPDAINSTPDAPKGKSHQVVLGENSGVVSFPSDAIYEEGDLVAREADVDAAATLCCGFFFEANLLGKSFCMRLSSST